MRRKLFIKNGITGLVGMSIPLKYRSLTYRDKPAPIDNETIKEFVVAGHGDLEKVREMMAEMPNLLYCRYDWGVEILKKLSKAPDISATKKLPTF